MESPTGASTTFLLPSGLTKVTLIVFFAARGKTEDSRIQASALTAPAAGTLLAAFHSPPDM